MRARARAPTHCATRLGSAQLGSVRLPVLKRARALVKTRNASSSLFPLFLALFFPLTLIVIKCDYRDARKRARSLAREFLPRRRYAIQCAITT